MSQYPGNPYPGGGNAYPYPLPVESQQPPTAGITYPLNTEQYPPSANNNPENFQPSVLPVDKIERVPGYENVTFTTTTLPPPPICEDLPNVPPVRPDINRGAGITEEEAKEAAIQYVSEHCCYGKDPVENMVIRDIAMSSAFHYTLETFAEKRETKWEYHPYKGGILDTPLMGVAPAPWDIPLEPKKQFSDSVQTVEVPHTASAITCHVCAGNGRERCSKCLGTSMELCSWCNGSGKKFNEACNHCYNGRIKCSKCDGIGYIKCKTCDSKGSLKYCVKLTATWKNHKDDFIVEHTNLPEELIRDVTGDIAFEEKCIRVWPVNHFQPNINNASKQLIQKHSQAFQLERILQQRHRVRIIPVAEVKYSWKDKNGEFYVYGFENKVYFPDYPQSCCWGCNIL